MCLAARFSGQRSDLISAIDVKFLELVTVHRNPGVKVDQKFHEHVCEVLKVETSLEKVAFYCVFYLSVHYALIYLVHKPYYEILFQSLACELLC